MFKEREPNMNEELWANCRPQLTLCVHVDGLAIRCDDEFDYRTESLC